MKRGGIKPALNEAELKTAGDPLQTLKLRQSEGSPAPDDVRRQASGLNAAAARIERSVKSRLSKINTARKQCLR